MISLEAGIKIILGVDAIFHPLTGIGRYAWELARGLQNAEGIADIRYFAMGRWMRQPEALLAQSDAGRSPARTLSVTLALRRRLALSPLAVRAYSLITPLLYWHRLRHSRDYLFHSPNYFLPPFPGPAVATFHDLSSFRYPQFHPPARVVLTRREIPRTLRRAAHLITDSEAIRREVIEFFSWPAERVTAVPLGVDAAFRPRAEAEVLPVLGRYGLAPGNYALCVATIEPRKNIGNLLQAYARLPVTLRNRYPLVLAGDRGWRSEPLHERIEQVARAGWLKYLGYVPQEDLPALFAGARGFLLPSLYEGFGLTVLEAMASGIPVLTSNGSSLAEVAQGAALLVEPEDVPAMTESIRIVLDDEGWRRAAVNRSRDVAARYSWEATVRNTVEIYRKVLAA